MQGKPNAMEHFLGHKGNFTLTLTVRMIYDFGWWSLNPVESANIVMNVHGVAACDFLSSARRLSWFLPVNTLKAFYFAYITTRFDYCSLVWDTCCSSDYTPAYNGFTIMQSVASSCSPEIFFSIRGSIYPPLVIPL